VFEATPQEERLECNSFDELSAVLLTLVGDKRVELENSIEFIGDAILKEDLLREQLVSQAATIQTQKEQIEKLKKELTELVPKNMGSARQETG
jgi:hypothetical protein